MAQAPGLPGQLRGDDWLEVTPSELPLGRVAAWAVVPHCGALAIFAGTVRDHSDGREGVVCLEYEAYESAALLCMQDIAADLRQRWPSTGRLALLHRTGPLPPTEVSVIVAISAPHRSEAFEAARFGIDAIKSRVPIWKRETWRGGAGWALEASPLRGVSSAAGTGA